MRRPWVASLALLLGCGPGRRAPAALGELRCDDLSPPALTAASLPELLQMARSLHPELADARIELVPSRSETVFFRADVKPGTLFGRRSRRIYRVHHSVALTDDQAAAMHQGVIMTEALYAQLVTWVETHYRDRVEPKDLADPQLAIECTTALEALERILGLHSGG